jgi:hypothetical protein
MDSEFGSFLCAVGAIVVILASIIATLFVCSAVNRNHEMAQCMSSGADALECTRAVDGHYPPPALRVEVSK